MSNFIILFNEKEGTSNLMMLLKQFRDVSIVHQAGGRGWEPFDWHLHNDLSMKALMQCLDLVYRPGDDARARLNRIYTKSAEQPLDDYHPADSTGFKMRVAMPPELSPYAKLVSRWGPRWLNELKLDNRRYERRLLSLLRKHQVVVLFAVRQDLFRWALSKYHGDGTGKDGHLQFDVAYGAKKRSEIPPIKVDPERFGKVIENRRSLIDEKLRLTRRMNRLGIRTGAVIYEDYLADSQAFFKKLMASIGQKVSDAEIRTVLDTGTPFRKVHSDDISEFVINHEEIESLYGNCTIDFAREMADAG